MGRGKPSAIAQDRLFEPLVSRKVANREVGTEGSGTTNLGTDPSAPLRINQAGTR